MTGKTKYAVGIDLGGTFVKYSIVASGGDIVFHDKLPACAKEGAEAVIGQIIEAVHACKEYAAAHSLSLEGVGLGTPGIISGDGRTVLGGAENITGWENIPLAQIIETREGLPTLLNNDANLMALAETMFGAARGCTDVVFLTIGTGIGGGVLIDGRLYGGYKNRGTELGHITIKYDGEPCACGSVGCLERYASTANLVRRYEERCLAAGINHTGEVNGETIIRLYFDGDTLATEAMLEHWRFLGQGIASLINIFSPQKVVIGGGISEAGDFYIEKIRENVNKYVLKESAAETTYSAAMLGNKSGCLGAAGLIFMERKQADTKVNNGRAAQKKC